YNHIKKFLLVLYFISVILLLVLPLNYYYENDIVYSYGASTNYLSFLALCCIIFWVISIVSNRNNIEWKKYIPLFSLIGCVLIALLIRVNNPGFLVISVTLFLTTFIMYFTIENPDMKMVEELEKNRKLIDRNIEEKSNLLFELSHEVREPLKKINEISYNYKNTNNVEELQESLKEINEKANDMSLLVNDILDISITSRKNMQIYEETYNPEALFKKLVMKFKEENNNRITFSYSIPESMPKELYGDSVKLKQIVNTVLTNAFKYTKEGYVDLKVTNINKYDIARLIITVEDTGCGMSIDKVNDILNNNKEFSKEELNNLEKINVGIKLANKLVIEMGGILVIKSEENKGTKVTIIIDEQIKEDSYNKMLEEDNYLRNTKIAILGDKTRKINKIRDLMKQYEVKTYLEKEELIEQIKKKEKYDLIILFDDMKPSGIEVLKSLKEIKGYKTPTVVLLEDNKTSIKEHYIKDGFTEYLLLSDINEEIKKLDKYLKG
ncbi:MAG: hybrid sensor histidine kinase/response regulator, partial [Tenericutes bacterium]|nr:hybrid sensor histidine kinase/response regulator [Mycoplasmatota bacterium]